jgi:hypothetical protein
VAQQIRICVTGYWNNPHATQLSTFQHIWVHVGAKFINRRSYWRGPVHSSSESPTSSLLDVPLQIRVRMWIQHVVLLPTSHARCVSCWTLIAQKDGLVEVVQSPCLHDFHIYNNHRLCFVGLSERKVCATVVHN